MARAPRFIPGFGPWHEYRTFGKVYEIDFHRGRRDPDLSYWDAMAQVGRDVFDALKFAQRNGYDFVLFTHGWSTSRLGATTSRSMVRGLMRSPEATPFILRSRSIQHESVFLAAIRIERTGSAGAGTHRQILRSASPPLPRPLAACDRASSSGTKRNSRPFWRRLGSNCPVPRRTSREQGRS